MLGRFLLMTLHREDKRLRNHVPCEPPTYYDQNDAAKAQGGGGRKAARLRSVGVGPVGVTQAVSAT